MTRTEKYKEKRMDLLIESLLIESVYMKHQSENLLKETKESEDWWKDYQLMEDIKPK